ncbi:MAG: sugar transferase, partial [Bacteroidota bacterium]
MSRTKERILLLLIDFLTINGAFVLYFWLRIQSGVFGYVIEPDFLLPMAVIYLYWLFLFAFFGLYRPWYPQSRLDEVLTLFRTTGLGMLVLLFVIWMDDESTGAGGSRWLIATYWMLLFGFVTGGRLGIRSLQRRLLERGIGARNALIVGWSPKAFDLCSMIQKSPALGYKPIGFVTLASRSGAKRPKVREEYQGVPVVGKLTDLPDLIPRFDIREVLVGLDSTEHDRLLDIVKYCNGFEVGMKIVPDLYDIVSGQARVSSIYGVPLIDVSPELLRPWEAAMKRVVDVLISAFILLAGSPFWFLVALLTKIDSKGPVFYRQERVGRNGAIFNMLKFRSMVHNAEQTSGPKWAEKDDPRVTRVGWIIRKLHIDEVPQFINVLRGDMSLVGPRPERPYFVEQLSKKIPLYRRRLKIRPGITGWAQVKYRYDQSVEDVKTKLKYDLFYIENMSWRMDMKILF